MGNNSSPRGRSVAVIGGGPAGLMAAETLSHGGVQVDVYDAMPSVGRKFLLAGKGGMNITHSEANDIFLSRYGARRHQIAPLIGKFDASSLRDWVHGLGIDTFAGTSGRVFPTEMKAAPLLRAWLHRLRVAGVRFHMRHRWIGWTEANGGHGLRFSTPDGEQSVHADAAVLALGGGSWPRLGSDGAWAALLEQQGIAVAPLRPANCGFNTGWSEHFRARFAGHPVKTVVASCGDGRNGSQRRQGEFVVTDFGVEGGLIYALSAPLRDEIAASGSATLYLDLAPGKDLQRVINEIAYPRGSRSISSHLQSRVGITGVKTGLLRELMPAEAFADPVRLGNAVKALPLRLRSARPIEEAISSAGGVLFDAFDDKLMLRALPGVFCAGEMLDWEAPTGGYLLTACFAMGRHAGAGVLQWLDTVGAKSENAGLR